MKKQVYALLLLLFIPYYSFAQWLTSGTNIYNSNTGNVGVGTSTPSEKLHINGTIRGNSTGGALRVKTQFGYLEIGPQNSFYSQFYTDITRGFYFNNSLTVNGNISSFNVSDLNLQTYDGSTYYNRMTIVRSTGFIGVNKTNPAYQLDVAGTVNATSYLLNGSPLSTSQWTTNGTTINYATGNVGIGTTSPAATLDIVSPTSTALRLSSDNSCIQQIYTAGNDSYFMGGFILYRSRGTVASPLSMQANDRVGAFGGNSWINGAYRGTASMEIFTGSTPSATSNPGYIIFKTVANNNTVAAERVRISESGFVGINKTNPAYHIDVAGTVNATSYLVNGSPLSTSQWTTNGTTINYATGNVGIGQSTPAFKLDVAGTINASSILINGQPFAGGGSQWATAGSSINYLAGNVGIGTTSPDAKLAVKGTIHTNEVKVDLNGAVAPDYVFEKDYNLMSLEETKAFIDANKHLPEVPSASEIEKNGIHLGEMNMLLLKKVEELTLNLIAINERLKQIENENKELRKNNENKK